MENKAKEVSGAICQVVKKKNKVAEGTENAISLSFLSHYLRWFIASTVLQSLYNLCKINLRTQEEAYPARQKELAACRPKLAECCSHPLPSLVFAFLDAASIPFF